MHRFNTVARALLLAALVPATVWAEGPKVVVVHFAAGEGATEQQAKKFTKELEDQLKARGDFTLATAPSASPRGKAEATAKATKQHPDAVPTMEAGKKAYADFNFIEAAEKLKKGIELTLQDPPSIDWPRLIEAQLDLAVASFRNGEEKEAAAALTTLARWAPATDVSSFPPVFQTQFEKAKKRLEKAGKVTLTVDGPSGATAFINGRDLGMVPVEESVAPGTHYVKVEGNLKQGQRWGQAVAVTAATKVKAVFPAGGTPDAPAAIPVEPRLGVVLDGKSAEKLSQWCGATGADFAIVGAVWRHSDTELGVASVVYWPRKEGFASLSVGTYPEGGTAGPEAVKALDKLAERLEMFGTTLPLPHQLLPRTVARAGGDDVTVATVRDRPTPVQKDKPRLVPQDDGQQQIPVDEPPPEVKTEMSTAAKVVLIVGGVVLAAGIGVGTYFVVSNATRPVTGTVTATW